MRFARAGDRAAPDRVDVEREADRLELRGDALDLRLGHVRDDEVLEARDADVPADALGQPGDGDHLVAGDQSQVDRGADVDEPGLPLLVDAEMVGGRRRHRRQRESTSLRPRRASTRSRMPSGPMSSIMNLRRALTRETR